VSETRIDQVEDLFVRGRLSMLQEIVLSLDNHARDLRNQIADLENVTGSRPHMDQVMAKLRSTLVFERLLEVNATAERFAAMFAQEAKEYEEANGRT